MTTKEKKMVVLKDIIIPAGTVLTIAPTKTERYAQGHYSAIVGLSDNTAGEFEYFIDPDYLTELQHWFAELIE